MKIVKFLVWGWIVLAMPVSGWGQTVPVYFGNEIGIVDEFGQILDGTAANPGDLVHILRTSSSVGIIPPGPDGTPSTNNPILTTVYIGNGTEPTNGPSGLFSGSVNVDRTVVNEFFARAYNGTNLASSSFYADSQIFSLPAGAGGAFVIAITQTSIEIDPNDDDGDGLSNSWEKSLGTDKLVQDTDGDGLSDYQEFLAGTDGLDENDFLQMVELAPVGIDDLLVQWSSSSGRVYQVEYTTNLLSDAAVEYQGLYDPVAATTEQSSIVVTNGGLLGSPHFRVRLLP